MLSPAIGVSLCIFWLARSSRPALPRGVGKMAQLIQPILDTFRALLQAMDASTLGDLPPFAEVKSAGMNLNFPYGSVEPGKTAFDPAQDQSAAQGHSIVIQIGVNGTEPEALKTARSRKR